MQALDSLSGWATLCDPQGKFTLPDVLWYPDATYDLIVSADEDKGEVVKVSAGSLDPSTGVVNVGRLALNTDHRVDLSELPGDNSYTYEYFDFQNRDYYRSVFDELTAHLASDEEKVDAVNNYVAAKLNYKETQWELGSPRRILEYGSQYCGHLSTAMATILAVAFPVRIIHLTDRAKILLNSLADIYSSGHHHFYYLAYKCSQYAHAWWAYKNGLSYVPSGGRILLAAAGIRPGTCVTYHIRKPGSNHDELTLVSRRAASASCVLNEEESQPINLAPGFYNVFVDLYDENVATPTADSPALISDWQLRVKLEVR